MGVFTKCLVAIFFLMACAVGAKQTGEKEIVSAKDGCPTIEHAPVLETVRGVPVEIIADVTCPTGHLGEVFLQLRLTDLGKPKEFRMKDEGNGKYKAIVPVSMIQGLPRFWYYIDARGTVQDDEATRAQTPWRMVTIVDPKRIGGFWPREASWLGAGLAALGGGFLIHDNSHDHDTEQSNPSVSPVASGDGGGEGSNSGRSSPQRSRTSGSSTPQADPPAPSGTGTPPATNSPPCTGTTGDEFVDFQNTSPCAPGDIQVRVCFTCPNAKIEVSTSWGPYVQTTASELLSCDYEPGATINIAKPVDPDIGGFAAGGSGNRPIRRGPSGGAGGAEREDIYVIINGVPVAHLAWPTPAEWSACP